MTSEAEPPGVDVGFGVGVVVKVGGSLLDWPGFPRALGRFLASVRDRDPALVVGGGALVDVLRRLDAAHGLGPARSHDLALRALDVTAYLVAGLAGGLEVVGTPEALRAVRHRGSCPVLAPRAWFARYGDGLPEDWDTTTDSIAARVAEGLGARALVLLKSGSPGAWPDRESAARAGFVDPRFPAASRAFERVEAVNLRAEPFEAVVWT